MAEVIWLEEARGDLLTIIRYIEQFDENAADTMGRRLYALGESLADFPKRGRAIDGVTREMPTVPPYVLRYTVEGDRVFILSIRHGRQRPRS